MRILVGVTTAGLVAPPGPEADGRVETERPATPGVGPSGVTAGTGPARPKEDVNGRSLGEGKAARAGNPTCRGADVLTAGPEAGRVTAGRDIDQAAFWCGQNVTVD